MIFNTSTIVLRYRGGKDESRLPEWECQGRGQTRQTEESTSTVSPALAANLSQRSLALSFEGRAGAASSDHSESQTFLRPYGSLSANLQNDVVVVDRLSRILTHAADTSAPSRWTDWHVPYYIWL